MKLLFCTTGMPVSRLIRWLFNEPVSHFAMEFDDKLIIHSSFLGINLDWKPWFYVEHLIVSTLVPVTELSLDEEENYYQEILKKKPSRPGYDYKAFFYFGWCGLKYKLFGTPLPVRNPYNDKGCFLCTEEANLFGLTTIDTSITTPWMLRDYFLKTGKFVEATA